MTTTTNEPVMPACSHTPRAYDGPTRDEVLAMRREFLSPALVLYYKEPMMIVEGHMQWLFDEKGRRYLDAFAGIVTVSVGHCHPKVLDAVREQNERLQHTTTIYLHPNIAQFAKKLASTFPSGSDLKVAYFTNSGSDANELAMMMARLHTGNFDIIALRNAYHGMSTATMGLTAHGNWKYPVPQGFGVHHARLPDRLRGPYGYDDAEAGPKYAADVADLIQYATPGRIAAFIAEPIQGVGGSIELPDGYLKHVYESVRAAGGLCISDEVQTGFGRTGTAFWGFENHGVRPDIVTMAKGIGNGAPLGACVTTPAVSASMTGGIHFNTYGGNPVSMAQGMATLDVILEENIQKHAHDVGGYLKDGLKDIMSRHACVGDVRGQGLMLGLEFVVDRESNAPDAAMAADVMERCRDHGVIVGKGGLHGSALRIKPPMCITRDDVDFLVRVLDMSITEATSS